MYFIKKISVMAAILGSLSVIGCSNAIQAGVDMGVGMTLDSVEAPQASYQTFDGGVLLTWLPVCNVSEYVIFRDNVYLGRVSSSSTLEFYDLVSTSETDNVNVLENGKTYSYAIQAIPTGANMVATMAGKITILSVTVSIPAYESKVKAAENVSITPVVEKGKANIYYSAPKYLKSTIEASIDSGTKTISLPCSRIINVDSTKNQCSIPLFGGSYNITITTSWKDSYYTPAVLSQTAAVPASDKSVPDLTIDTESDASALKLTFTDTAGATYRLFKAQIKDGKYDELTEITPSVWNKTESAGSTAYEFSESKPYSSYVYILTGTLNNKALKFSENAIKVFSI